MNQGTQKIVPLAALAVILIASSPLAYASTLTVNLNPTTGLAKVDSVSTTKIVFTFPAGSAMSGFLQNVSSTFSLNGTYSSRDSGVQALQSSFDREDSHALASNSSATITHPLVKNASVSIDYTAKGNATALVVSKVTDITSWVSGIFTVVNGSVKADLGWRGYAVGGPMDFDMGGRSVDVNMVGSAMQDSLAGHVMAMSFLLNAFGGGNIWSRSTLNFSALNAPLSTWTKNYDASTNTTTFTKTISGQSTFSSSFTFGSQNYSLSMISDPTGQVSIQGYADAQGDSLVVASAPASGTMAFLIAGVIAAAVIALGGYFAIRRGVRPKAPPA